MLCGENINYDYNCMCVGKLGPRNSPQCRGALRMPLRAQQKKKNHNFSPILVMFQLSFLQAPVPFTAFGVLFLSWTFILSQRLE